jgi:hypothetical protein
MFYFFILISYFLKSFIFVSNFELRIIFTVFKQKQLQLSKKNTKIANERYQNFKFF